MYLQCLVRSAKAMSGCVWVGGRGGRRRRGKRVGEGSRRRRGKGTNRDRMRKGRRRPIGCLIFTGHFSQTSPIISGSFAKNDLHLRHPVGLCHPVCSFEELPRPFQPVCGLVEEVREGGDRRICVTHMRGFDL